MTLPFVHFICVCFLLHSCSPDQMFSLQFEPSDTWTFHCPTKQSLVSRIACRGMCKRKNTAGSWWHRYPATMTTFKPLNFSDSDKHNAALRILPTNGSLWCTVWRKNVKSGGKSQGGSQTRPACFRNSQQNTGTMGAGSLYDRGILRSHVDACWRHKSVERVVFQRSIEPSINTSHWGRRNSCVCVAGSRL